MYLRNINIRNFRCLKFLDLELGAGLNVIVGENNSGKTAVIDAIRAALGPAAATGDNLRLYAEDRYRGEEGKYCTEPIQITLIFANLSIEEQAQFIELLNYNPEAPEDSTAQFTAVQLKPVDAQRVLTGQQ